MFLAKEAKVVEQAPEHEGEGGGTHIRCENWIDGGHENMKNEPNDTHIP